jgi:uncharacterized YccA/Bax inhibitor family protein
MFNLSAYPYPDYLSDKIAAGCVAGVVGISLIAWFIQSCQTRFRPTRLSILLLISHLAIFIELIVRAAVSAEQENSRTIFTVFNSLFATGQRMIIVGNYSFVLEIHHEKSRRSRAIFIVAILCIVTSGILIAPANLYSFDPGQINTSFIYRQISAAVLLTVTVLFFPVLYWSKTIKDMTTQGFILIIVSSLLCLTVAIFNMIQSISIYYDEINSQEGWFYGFQMTPIILAHFSWSIFHPKRSLKSFHTMTLETRGNMRTDEELLVEKV